MTVSSTSSRTVLAGDGSNTSWPFAFRVQQPADLVVVYTDLTGSDFTLAPGQYDATGFGQDSGGTVTYPAAGSGSPAIATGTLLTIQRVVAATQPTTISNQGAMWPAVIEAALDRITMIVQGFIDGMNRGLRIAPSDGAALNVLPNATTRANSVLGFDGDGQPYAATLSGSLVGVATWLVQNFLGQATSAANARAALGAIALADVGAGATVAAAGSYALPNGPIVKWGTSGSIAASGNATVTPAAAFPAALFGVVLTPLANATGYVDSGGAASFRIHNTGTNSATFFWVAFGN
jgi:hypothetical protein